MQYADIGIDLGTASVLVYIKGKGVVLKKGSLVCLFAAGVMVHFALQAARLLEADGVSTMVVNLHTIKPLDEELILNVAKNVEFLFSVEEHSKIGGLGEAIASFLCETFPKKLLKIAVKDKFSESGSVAELLKKNELNEVLIYKKVKSVVLKKTLQ